MHRTIDGSVASRQASLAGAAQAAGTNARPDVYAEVSGFSYLKNDGVNRRRTMTQLVSPVADFIQKTCSGINENQ